MKPILRFVPRILLIFFITASYLFFPQKTSAAPALQDEDPVLQCSQGVNLLLDNKGDEALPFLRAGFNNREKGVFSNPNDLISCASALGVLYASMGDFTEALIPLDVALDISRSNNNKFLEASTLDNIAKIYEKLENYEKTLEYYQLELLIQQELGEPKKEEVVLYNIDKTYSALENYGEAIEYYQQVLVMAREEGNESSEATVLYFMAKSYDALDDFESALKYYQQTLPMQRKAGSRDHEGAVTLDMANIYANKEDYQAALEYYEETLIILQELNSSSFTQGYVLYEIGQMYSNLKLYDQALDAYHQAIEFQRKTEETELEGITLQSLASVFYELGQHDNALEYYEIALEVLHQVNYQEREMYVLGNIAKINLARAQYAIALDYYQQALIIARELNAKGAEGRILTNIGEIYEAQGHRDKSLEYYQYALTIEQDEEDRFAESAVLNNMGAVYLRVGRYAEALEHFQRALVIAQRLGNREDEASIQGNIAAIYSHQGRYDLALELFELAFSIHQEIGDLDGQGTVLANIGTIYNAQGKNPEALEILQQSLDIRQSLGDKPGEISTLNSIGNVYRALGRETDALSYYKQALTIAREIGHRSSESILLHNIGMVYLGQFSIEALEYFNDALIIHEETANQEGIAITSMNLGHIYYLVEEYDKALTYYDQSMAIFETLRSTSGSDLARASYIEQHIDIYEFHILLDSQEGDFEKAFSISERGRARSFLDSMSTESIELHDDEKAALYNQEQEAYTVRETARDALTYARTQSPDEAQLINELESQLAQAEQDYQNILDKIQSSYNELAALVPGRSTTLELKDVQSLLNSQTTLASYWVMENKTLVFVIGKNDFHAVEIEITKEELEALIIDFRQFPSVEENHPQSAIDLYNTLISPVKEHLNTQNLIIVPHSILHYLPFSALTDGQSYLLDDYSITYLPSASTLPFVQDNAVSQAGLPLILGNPTTGDYDATASLATERDGLAPLPYAEREAEEIASLYGTQVYVNQAATESLVKENASQTSILHLAAHGVFNPHAPLSSLIALAPDDKNDGWLTVGEVYGLELQNAELVVLSACETQLGDLTEGDELVGLTRAFLFAGTPTVIGSLWTVDDQATAELMELFYKYLQDGKGKAEALRQAQIEVREKYPNPYYWAAFVLNGEGGDSLVLESSTTEPSSAQNKPSIPFCGGNLALIGVILLFGHQTKKKRVL
ncbi:MAG: hypothetical protein DRO01_03925 [Thermoproteota archaeon]|nr:MAG: hypothetical protein DRO01_03925 [Candidatus Korarchaeota archaeon]